MAFAENPFTYAANHNTTSVDTPPITFQVVGRPDQRVEFRASCPVKKRQRAISGEQSLSEELLFSESGTVLQLRIDDVNSFLKVSTNEFQKQ